LNAEGNNHPFRRHVAGGHHTRSTGHDERATALLEMPLWLVIVLALLGGLSGEMWRADKAGARGWSLMRRLALRSGACMVCGVSTVMLLYATGMSIWSASAFGCLTAMAGADVAIGLYERWAAKRLGLREPINGDQPWKEDA
jgi:Kef-type K+ transport system membrane component KefB